jgi:hypothetical protein
MYILENGKIVGEFCGSIPALAPGWTTAATPEPAALAAYRATCAGLDEPQASPDILYTIDVSKLSLRRALRQRGLEGALNTVLAANPPAKADWDDATILRTDDPLLVAAMPALCQQAGISAEQAQALLESCRA